MGIDFLIEDKVFEMPDNFYELSEYTLKSSPRPYHVSVKNNPDILGEIQFKLDENPKNLLFVDEKVYDLYFKDLKVDKSRVFLAQANEEFKTLTNGFLKLIAFMEDNEFTKSDTLIAAGGGGNRRYSCVCGRFL